MNKKISLFVLIILALSLFGSSPKPVHAQDWWNQNWSYRVTIEIDHTKIEATQYDFPVLIYLNSSKINWAHVQDDLDDLRFIDTDEITQLYAELENYTVNNEAWIWVKIPAIYYPEMGTNQLFYLYYGNNAVSSWWNPEDVWEDSAVMVQHMRDNPDNAHVMDSTQYDNDGTKKAANEPIETAGGEIDGAQDFDGTNDYIDVNSLDAYIFGKSHITIGSWIKFSASQDAKNVIGWWWGNDCNIRISNNRALFQVTADGIGFAGSDNFLNDGLWYHVVATYDAVGGADNVKLYVDGAPQAETSTTTGNMISQDKFNIGSINDGAGYFFNGDIDEARIYNEAKSAEWILADYNSGADTLLIYGAEELCPLALTILYNTGINKLYINGTERANNTTIYVDKNVNVNATVTVKPNFIFMKYALGSTGASLIPTYIFNMTNPFTLWSYATPNFFIYEEPTTFTFTHWLILLFIALVISLLAAIKFHIIATVSLILVLYMVINVASYTGIILLAIIVWLLTIMFSIIAFGEI